MIWRGHRPTLKRNLCVFSDRVGERAVRRGGRERVSRRCPSALPTVGLPTVGPVASAHQAGVAVVASRVRHQDRGASRRGRRLRPRRPDGIPRAVEGCSVLSRACPFTTAVGRGSSTTPPSACRPSGRARRSRSTSSSGRSCRAFSSHTGGFCEHQVRGVLIMTAWSSFGSWPRKKRHSSATAVIASPFSRRERVAVVARVARARLALLGVAARAGRVGHLVEPDAASLSACPVDLEPEVLADL